MHRTILCDKLLYLRMFMSRYLKIVGILVLALTVWQTSNAIFTVGSTVSVADTADIQARAAAHCQDEV